MKCVNTRDIHLYWIILFGSISSLFSGGHVESVKRGFRNRLLQCIENGVHHLNDVLLKTVNYVCSFIIQTQMLPKDNLHPFYDISLFI